eukprot:4250228-Pleurochrysis_carterae.AAC.1
MHSVVSPAGLLLVNLHCESPPRRHFGATCELRFVTFATSATCECRAGRGVRRRARQRCRRRA